MEQEQNNNEKGNWCDVCERQIPSKLINEVYLCGNCIEKAKEGMVKSKYGFLPVSIWHIAKDKVLSLSVRDDIGKDSYANNKQLSEFNPLVANRIIRYWSKPGDWLLDPFAGRNRALMAYNTARNYVGYEISQKVCAYLNDKLQAQRRLIDKNISIEVINADCGTMEYNEKFDLAFSCPPYWDVEDYNKLYGEANAHNLGSMHNYDMFLAEYEKVIAKVYKALKDGKFCVWVVNDIRRDKQLIPFHVDTINIFLRNGFFLHDIVINELNSLSILGLQSCDANNYTAKIHEYILVFRK